MQRVVRGTSWKRLDALASVEQAEGKEDPVQLEARRMVEFYRLETILGHVI
jgi:hypothetical protein